MPNGTIFIVFSFVIRIFDGVGGAMAMTALMAFLAMCFPDNVGSVMVRTDAFEVSFYWYVYLCIDPSK